MSSVPFYAKDTRFGRKARNTNLEDGLVSDGLTDVYDNVHMGVCAEICAEEMKISRDEQDKFALESYKKSKTAWESGFFNDEITAVKIQNRRGETVVDCDEEYKNINIEKFKNLKTVFKKDGTITAGNASTINDGAAAVILMSEDKANEMKIKPLARILAYADTSQEPKWFTTSPTSALEKALRKANLKKESVDFWELNEAFQLLELLI